MANRDLTKGEPGRILRAYCLPMFGSVFFQQMYNLADSFTAGRFIGEAALAAVGNSYELTLIYLAFALGCNTGASVVVARYFGAKRYDRVKTAIFTALIATGVVCAALLLAGMALAAPLLRAIRTPSNTFRDSITYLKIYTAALPFVFFYNVTNGIFCALGDSKNAVSVPRRLLLRQCRAGYSVCGEAGHEGVRRGMGDVPLSGSGLHTGRDCTGEENQKA